MGKGASQLARETKNTAGKIDRTRVAYAPLENEGAKVLAIKSRLYQVQTVRSGRRWPRSVFGRCYQPTEQAYPPTKSENALEPTPDCKNDDKISHLILLRGQQLFRGDAVVIKSPQTIRDISIRGSSSASTSTSFSFPSSTINFSTP